MAREAAQALLAAFCADLRLLWEQAGGPSLRVLEHRLHLGKSQLGQILTGRVRRPPDWRVVAGLVGVFVEHAIGRRRADRLSVPTDITEYWRPRFAVLEHAFSQPIPRPAPAAVTPWAWVPPSQLPHPLPTFAGRVDELARLDALLPVEGTRSVAPTLVVVLSGPAAVGKTTLAVVWAHRVLPRYPDGQLYVNLRGFDPRGPAVEPAFALRGFLDALGIPMERMPRSPDAQAALYRSLLAGRRVLILADNAGHEDDVRSLLPGTAGSLVVVTSRALLSGLVATEGARILAIDLPSAGEAREMLVARLGNRRIEAAPSAAAGIVTATGRLPLALAVVAARAESCPALSLTDLVEQLRAARSPLDSFDGDDPATDIRSVFSWSYRAVGEPAARLFRLLSRCPGADVSPATAASAAGLRPTDTGVLLAELTRAHLLSETGHGRVGVHELLRAYAMEMSDQHDSVDDRRAVQCRLWDHYVHTAHAAVLRINPTRSIIDLAEPADGVAPQTFHDRESALAWFATELPALLSLMNRDSEGWERHAWRLGYLMHSYLVLVGRWYDDLPIQQSALRAAQRIDDRVGRAYMHRMLGEVQVGMGQFGEAQYHCHAAIELFEELADPVAMAYAYMSLGNAVDRLGFPRDGVGHTDAAYRLFRTAGDRRGQALAANNLACQYSTLGEHAAAFEYCREAMELFEELGHVTSLGNAWATLGELYFNTGRLRVANDCYRRALAVFRRVGDRFGEARIYTYLGDNHAHGGRRAVARRAWRRAVTILDDLGHDGADKLRLRLGTAA